MRRFLISLVAVLQLFALAPVIGASDTPFTDVPQSYWAHTYIGTLWTQGIVNGRTPTMFMPDATVTRAELVKMVVVANHVTVAMDVESSGFVDVPVSHALAPYIAKAKELGWVHGVNSYFYPNQPVTRFEAVKIMLNAFIVPLLAIQTTTFTDVSTGEQAKYIETARARDIVQGYSSVNFRPNWPMTRAEVSKIVALLLLPPPPL